jgi:hypothetical protein
MNTRDFRCDLDQGLNYEITSSRGLFGLVMAIDRFGKIAEAMDGVNSAG